MINAKRSCIAPNLNCKSFVKTTYCKHGVVVICQSDSHSPGSTAAFFFSTALCQGFGSSFDPHWHERLDSWTRKRLLAAWLPVMALHEANQARSSHYLQWHCGLKLHLLVTNDILHLLGKHSTTSPQRAHHHQPGQRSDVLPRYRLVPCKQLSKLRNKERRVHSWSNPNQYSCAPRLGYFVCTRSTVNFAKLVNNTSKLMTIQSSSLCGDPWSPVSTTCPKLMTGRHTSILLTLGNRLQRLSCKTQENYVQKRLKLQLQNRSSTPQRKKDDFEALFKGTFKRTIISAKIEKICWQITVAALMQPLQYYLRDPAAKDNSITHAAAAASNLDAVITMRFAASHRKPARIYTHGNSRWQSCSHSNAIRNRRLNTRIELRTQEQPLDAEHRGGTHLRQTRPQPQPPHSRGTFHRRLQPLYTEKCKISCSGFLPKTKPMQHSCSHYNAFCSITWLTRISLRTWQNQTTTIIQPLHGCIVMWCQVSHHSLTPPFIECIVTGKSHP